MKKQVRAHTHLGLLKAIHDVLAGDVRIPGMVRLRLGVAIQTTTELGWLQIPRIVRLLHLYHAWGGGGGQG